MRLLTAEWLLDSRANGGGVILIRALWAALVFYGLTLFMRELTDDTPVRLINVRTVADEINGTLTIFGALLAIIYAALYARYTAQWAYLAGLYNQICATEATMSVTTDGILAQWKAAFIEDAEDVHLSMKPAYAQVIQHWLSIPEIKAAFVDAAPGGQPRLDSLTTRVDIALASESARWPES